MEWEARETRNEEEQEEQSWNEEEQETKLECRKARGTSPSLGVSPGGPTMPPLCDLCLLPPCDFSCIGPLLISVLGFSVDLTIVGICITFPPDAKEFDIALTIL